MLLKGKTVASVTARLRKVVDELREVEEAAQQERSAHLAAAVESQQKASLAEHDALKAGRIAGKVEELLS